MTTLTFQTKFVYVEIEVENPKSRDEIYKIIAVEYGKQVAKECLELYDKHDYLID